MHYQRDYFTEFINLFFVKKDNSDHHTRYDFKLKKSYSYEMHFTKIVEYALYQYNNLLNQN